MKSYKGVPFAFSLAFLLTLSLPVFAAGPSFQTSSSTRTLRNEGFTEVVGEVVFQVNNPSATTTIVAGSSLALTYSVPITVNPGLGNIRCVVGGVTGCPAGLTLSLSGGNTVIISFGSSATLTAAGDGFTVSGLRADVTTLAPGANLSTIISTFSPAASTNPVTVTQSLLPVGSVISALSPATSSVNPAVNPTFSCLAPGPSAIIFNVIVGEGFANAFTTQAQEQALSGAPSPSSGTTIEVTLQNVPVGVTVTPTSTSGLVALPGGMTQAASGEPMTFSFPFTSTDASRVEMVTIGFTAGYTQALDVATATGPITVTTRLGPVSTASTKPIVSFIPNVEATGTAFMIVNCQLQTTPGGTIRPQVTSGTKSQASIELYDNSTVSSMYAASVTTTNGGNWLSVSPTSGTQPLFLNVISDATNLGPGTYNGSITFSAFGSTPIVVPVVMTVVANVPLIVVAPTSLTFSAQVGMASPASQTVNISNGQGGPLSWTASATTSTGGTWLTVSPASSAASGPLTVSTNISGLAAGSYSGSIQVSATGATNSPQTIPVTLNVQTAPTITLSPSSLSFSAAAGSNPATQTVTIGNSGSSALGVNVAATSQTGNWLSVTPTTGVAPVTETVTVNSASLPAGTYTGTITVTAVNSPGVTNSPQTIPVTLSIGTPVINAAGVVNAGSYAPGVGVAPGAIVSLFGVRLAGTATQNPGLPLPLTLAGTQVLVNGSNTGAPLFSVSPTQINFQVPVDATTNPLSVVVVSNGLVSPAVNIPEAAQGPGIFTITSDGKGQAAAINGDGNVNGSATPVTAGGLITLFATGLGATNPALATGQVGVATEPLNRAVVQPTVTVNGVQATVQFAGRAPGFVGLDQINVFVPQGTASGTATVQITVPGVSSNQVTIAVK